MMKAFSSSQKQRGAALVVALIMLIMVSLLAAGGFFLATTEARGAAGWSDRQRAMFAAEGVLKEAEAAVKLVAAVEDVRLAVKNKGTGYFVRHEDVVPEMNSDWDVSKSIKATAADRVTELYYMVVYEGTAPQLDQAFQAGNGNVNKTSVRPRFTIYAKAGGIKQGTYVVLSTSKEF